MHALTFIANLVNVYPLSNGSIDRDPDQKLRAMIYYLLNVGRNMQEILRIVDALQTADRNSCALPPNWRPSEAIIIPAPTTQAEAEKRTKEGYECVDWFLCKKKLETLSLSFSENPLSQATS